MSHTISENLKIIFSTCKHSADCSENYATKCHTEIQVLYFCGSRKLLTLHTSMYYMMIDSALHPAKKLIQRFSSFTISEDLQHTASAVFAHLEPIFKQLSEKKTSRQFIFLLMALVAIIKISQKFICSLIMRINLEFKNYMEFLEVWSWKKSSRWKSGDLVNQKLFEKSLTVEIFKIQELLLKSFKV